jgi:hypothetical protein
MRNDPLGLGAESGPSLVAVILASDCGSEVGVDSRLKQGEEKGPEGP